MNLWETILTAFGSAALGGGLTGYATWSVFQRQDRSLLAAEIRAALGIYFSALVIAYNELSSMPDVASGPEPISGALRRAPGPVSRWYSNVEWRRRETGLRRVLGDVPFRNLERLIVAYGTLQVFRLPPDLDAAIERSLAYIGELGESRAADVLGRWPAIRGELRDAARRHVADADKIAAALGANE